MPKFRKKPVEIEAQGPLTFDNALEIARWCGGGMARVAKVSDPTDFAVSVRIPTLEGVMIASRGDYVIRGVKGEFYPCKPDIFEQTYDPVDATAP